MHVIYSSQSSTVGSIAVSMVMYFAPSALQTLSWSRLMMQRTWEKWGRELVFATIALNMGAGGSDI